MMRYRYLLAALIILLALAKPVRPAAGQSGPLLSCRLEKSQLHPGEKTTLLVEVTNISGLFGFQFELRFPAKQVALIDGDTKRSGTNFGLGDFLKPDFVAMNTIDLLTGKGSLALTQMNPSPARSGSGVLARVEVSALAEGKAMFAFTNVILADSQGQVIIHDLQGCALEVLSAGQPTAAVTATPQPTQPLPTATAASAQSQGESLPPTQTPVPPTATATLQPTSTGQVKVLVTQEAQAVQPQQPTSAPTEEPAAAETVGSQKESPAITAAPPAAETTAKVPQAAGGDIEPGGIAGTLAAVFGLGLLAVLWLRSKKA